MLSIIHIKGERQPSRESKFVINLPNYCSFYMMDKSLFCLESSVLHVLGGALGLTTRADHSEVCHTPRQGLEADVLLGGRAASEGG